MTNSYSILTFVNISSIYPEIIFGGFCNVTVTDRQSSDELRA